MFRDDEETISYQRNPLVDWFWAMFGPGLLIGLAFMVVITATNLINDARGPVSVPACPTAQSEAIQATWAVDDPRQGC